ncbi:MAG: DUF554 domain-containing protein [Desulfovibrionaceae bacterium]|nr:DUF554 domain-containing protein [Desulfovibrionaceae bacterium]MBR5734510.1 DUF554 domain-containing protein [Desulfovibrionaceae bacterium]
MPGLGTLINAAAIIAGGIAGLFGRRLLKERHQETVLKATGFAVIFLGASGTLAQMLAVSDGGHALNASGTMTILISLALGALIGEIINIDALFERFGAWLKQKTGSGGDSQFINAFVTASLTVSIGAMSVMGSIQDGVYGDYSTLAAKAAIDFVIVLIMSSSMGKGCLFSFIPVAVLQGGMTAAASLLAGCMTEPMLNNLSMVGNILIFCVGINLVWPNTIRAANLLPAIVIASALALL